VEAIDGKCAIVSLNGPLDDHLGRQVFFSSTEELNGEESLERSGKMKMKSIVLRLHSFVEVKYPERIKAEHLIAEMIKVKHRIVEAYINMLTFITPNTT
jgi:hypothetical protein